MIPRLVIVSTVAAAGALGLLAYLSDATAYAGSDPTTCGNCHPMADQYESWFHGGHHAHTVCTDCHLPHANIAGYFAEKGRQGAKDTWSFITKSPQGQLRATQRTRKLIQENCVRCHMAIVADLMAGPQPLEHPCWECHRSAAHSARGVAGSPVQDRLLYPSD